ncbi:calcineurin-like phosphoesterase family protein [Tenacibaculum adriaticum]|uniref:Calcineurin-like phosphoesterase family protein n=1 Tax=Tenacibaculum adriaticum TaxID=413713 RepID=A0A5S5DS76_9FLAO|nr:metallophosphoesterase [Tenacibaculum adriaticum]TYP97876.1 calcineurin-like phosphoesterase family protein [Tenacibaculum adriaticum]
MKKRILRYLKHILGTLLFLLLIGVSIVLFLNGNVHYSDNPIKKAWKKEGPYVFYKNDTLLSVNYVTGNRNDGFKASHKNYNINSELKMNSYFNLDDSTFDFTIDPNIKTPESIYNDGGKILAISDIESGYKTFRDFLINNQVINENLEWTFGNGHLVLVGDFVDRGFSTTQVLWFIYKLEQEAKKLGGRVHFILGNHEIKNLQGNYTKASLKYFYVASILQKQQYELYNSKSFIGKWLASKNTLEIINGHLFVHGGIHPELANYKTNINEINQIVRGNYRQAYYPKKGDSLEQLLISTTKGPSWYRGYFNDDLTNEEIDKGLKLFNAKAVIVGHTIQRKVKKLHNGKVFSIDVNHPKDYRKSWPNKQSEGLIITHNKYYRVFANGSKKEL